MKRTPRQAAERILNSYREVHILTTPHAPFEPEKSSDNAVILAVNYLADCAANDTLRAIVARLPHTADGIPVICDGMTVYCPKGHAHQLPHASGRLYCCIGDCWSDGCQGDSGSGTYYPFAACRATKPE
jgi:hypothetical protein